MTGMMQNIIINQIIFISDVINERAVIQYADLSAGDVFYPPVILVKSTLHILI